MKLADVLPLISLIADVDELRPGYSVVDGLWHPELRRPRSAAPTAEEARAEIERLDQAMADCTSNALHRRLAGQLAYWRCVRDLHAAAELVGPDDLPDVVPPDHRGVAMEQMFLLERFGQTVLEQAQAPDQAEESAPAELVEVRCEVCDDVIGRWPAGDAPLTKCFAHTAAAAQDAITAAAEPADPEETPTDA